MQIQKTNDIALPSHEAISAVDAFRKAEKIPIYDSLQSSKQVFPAFAKFEVNRGTVVMRVPDKIKSLDVRRYRDQIFKVPEAIDKYINMSMVRMRLIMFGVKGTDELGDILDDFGSKIVEAIDQYPKLNFEITDKMKMFRQKFLDYKRQSEMMAADRGLNIVT